MREASHEPNRPQRSHGAWPACARVLASISACRKVYAAGELSVSRTFINQGRQALLIRRPTRTILSAPRENVCG